MRGKIIVIEGTDGSGKETQSNNVEKYLTMKGLKVKKYSFPVYSSPTGKIVGASYLGKQELGESVFPETAANVDPLVSSLYYAADRRYNFLNEIETAVNENDVVILDRYTTSNMGHQACKAKNDEERDKILNFIETLEFDLCELPRPDLVVFLYMPFEASRDLRKGRISGDGLENSEEHQRKAEDNYLFIARKYGWNIVNCINKEKYTRLEDIKTIEEISKEIEKIIEEKLQNNEETKLKMTRY